MTTQTEKDFNNSAENKVVRYAEMRKKLDALYDRELSLAEKVYLHTVDHISSLLANVAFALDSHQGKRDAEVWRSAEGTFVSAGLLQSRKEYDFRFAFNRGFCEKRWKLGEQAFRECEDYQGTHVFQRAKAVF